MLIFEQDVNIDKEGASIGPNLGATLTQCHSHDIVCYTYRVGWPQ